MLERLTNKFVIITLICLGSLSYFNSFSNQFIWDDYHFFSQNQIIKNFDLVGIFTANTTAGGGVSSNYYRPLTSLTFAIDYRIWHDKVFGFHLTNTLFHILNALLVFWLLKKIRLNKLAAFLVPVIFLVHPIQTEAVTYLSSRGDILYTFFCLFSLILFAYSLYNGQLEIKIFRKKFVIFGKWLLFLTVLGQILSILSKEAGLSNMLAFAGVYIIFKQQRKLSFSKLHSNYRNQFITILIVGLISIIYFILRLTLLNFGDTLNYGGSSGVYATNILVRLLTFLAIFLSYVSWIFWPNPLYFERVASVVTSINIQVLASIILIGTAFLLGIREIKKFKSYWILFGLLIIFTSLLPVSGIIPQTALLHENWLYFPLVGFCLIAFKLIDFLPKSFKNQTLFGFSSISLITILIGLTIRQNLVWKDPVTFYDYNLMFTNSARLHLNLGNTLLGENKLDQASYHLNQAALIDDSYPQTHFNLGYIYEQQGQNKKAEEELLKSLGMDPNYLYSYRPLINLYVKTGQYPKALPYLQKLTIIYPNDYSLMAEYGGVLYSAGQVNEAQKAFNQAVSLSNNNPGLIQAINQLKSQK